MVKRIQIDGNAVSDIAYYEEINRVVMVDQSWRISQSLDAFNDLLYGSCGGRQGVQTS
ncbi:hypothetical protein [Spirosoma sp. KNUC1025]|uniref:hypothetical protein n=1 Tax=Spirosoma sp. KNUC1025 TaxID=2894082 RepID=UPI001E2D8C63|nr:hypothetical protein [Spirosoma sp. KNUC1025]UFH57842.1 hypothetical protein LN737_33030 [Spirosoma sp. KNUC1025]